MADVARTSNGADQDEFEACATVYVERYMDTVQNLPNDIQRLLSEIRELDALTCTELRDYEKRHSAYLEDIQSGDAAARRKSHSALRRTLLQEREYGDERLQLASDLIDLIEAPAKLLDEQLQALDATQYEAELMGGYRSIEIPVPNQDMLHPARNESRGTTSRARGGKRRPRKPDEDGAKEKAAEGAKRTKMSNGDGVLKVHGHHRGRGRGGHHHSDKGKISLQLQAHVPELIGQEIDPNEPVYCLCQKVSYGEMIGCDNDTCTIEWFHFDCVGLTSKPKGKWYCPRCRKDQSKSEKSKAPK